jgi:hypothetical protein
MNKITKNFKRRASMTKAGGLRAPIPSSTMARMMADGGILETRMKAMDDPEAGLAAQSAKLAATQPQAALADPAPAPSFDTTPSMGYGARLGAAFANPVSTGLARGAAVLTGLDSQQTKLARGYADGGVLQSIGEFLKPVSHVPPPAFSAQQPAAPAAPLAPAKGFLQTVGEFLKPVSHIPVPGLSAAPVQGAAPSGMTPAAMQVPKAPSGLRAINMNQIRQDPSVIRPRYGYSEGIDTATPGGVRGAHGGEVDGPGGPREDKVGPVYLSDDEYVLPAKTRKALEEDLGGDGALDEYVMKTNDGRPPVGIRMSDGSINAASGGSVPGAFSDLPGQAKTLWDIGIKPALRDMFTAAEKPVAKAAVRGPGFLKGALGPGALAGGAAMSTIMDDPIERTRMEASMPGFLQVDKNTGAVGTVVKPLVADAVRLAQNIGNAATFGGAGLVGRALASSSVPGLSPDEDEAFRLTSPNFKTVPAAATAPYKAPAAREAAEQATRPAGLRTTDRDSEGQRLRTITGDGGPERKLMLNPDKYQPTQYISETSSTPSLRMEGLHAAGTGIGPYNIGGVNVRPGSFDETIMRNRVNADIRARAPENINANNVAASLRGQDITAGTAAARLAAENARADRKYGLDLQRFGLDVAKHDDARKEKGVDQFNKNADRFAEETYTHPETGAVSTRVNPEKRNLYQDFYRRKGGWENLDASSREKVHQEATDAWTINNALQASGTKNNWFGDLFGEKQTNPGNTTVKIESIGPATTMQKAGQKAASIFERPDTPYIKTKHGALIPLEVIAVNGEASVAFRRLLERQGDQNLIKQYEQALGRIRGYGKSLQP